jgi:putative flippase GtrA
VSPSTPTWTLDAKPSEPPTKALPIFRIREFFRYFGVSLLALLVDAGGLFLLVEKAHWHYLPAAVLCFTLGSLVAFVLSTVWVFEEHSFRRWHDGFLAFTLIGLVGLVVNTSLLWSCTEWGGLPYMASKGVAAIGSFGINFILRKMALFTTRASSA